MKRFLPSFIFLCCFFNMAIFAQSDLTHFTRDNDERVAFKSELAPFYHGVASGDPTQNSVIIWTRITVPLDTLDVPTDTSDVPTDTLVVTSDTLTVNWFLAKDTDFTEVIAEGETTTSAEKDFTVKIDVTDLEPETTYYYVFQYDDIYSVAGRTRTAAKNTDHLRFVIASCSNYQHGFFNAYARIAERNDIDAVIHLGDYIYEYGNNPNSIRTGLLPETEILELLDYRSRYSFYRMDEDLQRMHQQHPIISVWDDHEVANDSYIDGAQNHDDATEGDYQERKSKAKQAYFEWMPVRDNPTKSVYRKISYGNLVDLMMIDTRHEARSQQIEEITEENLMDDSRTLLGETQKDWLIDALDNSTAQWKLIGNQVLFTPFYYQDFINVSPLVTDLVADIWEGYPIERNEIITHIASNDIDNVIVLTGDIHASFANDVPADPIDKTAYNSETGAGSAFVEFVTPSISSNNYDEYLPPTLSGGMPELITSTNPQVKQTNLFDHGYFVLDINNDRAQADWYYDPDRNTPSDTENYGMTWLTVNGQNHLIPFETESDGKTVQETPAPDNVTDVFSVGIKNLEQQTQTQNEIAILASNVMNNQTLILNYAVNEAQKIEFRLIDINGKLVYNKTQQVAEGLFNEKINLQKNLPSGNYFIQLIGKKSNVSRQVFIK